MPDEELLRLAKEKTQPARCLKAQVDRMLASPKSHSFIEDFTGQWLGTKEVGASGCVYRRQIQRHLHERTRRRPARRAVRVLAIIFTENRTLLNYINADYIFATERTAKIMASRASKVPNSAKSNAPPAHAGRPRRVTGLGAVHMITSYPDRTSPVLRGAWDLKPCWASESPARRRRAVVERVQKESERRLAQGRAELHRANPSCSACHNLMDPIGFGWRISICWAAGETTMASSPSIRPASCQRRKIQRHRRIETILLARKNEFARHISAKYAGLRARKKPR